MDKPFLPKKTKLVDIAEAAGVSQMTVSRVLNNYPHISFETRERVLRTAKELGYIPNPTAQALATGRTRLLGLVVGEMHSEYILEIIRGVEAETGRNNYNLVLVTSGVGQRQELTQASRLMGGMVDAMMFVLPREADLYLGLVSQNRLPCILIDHRSLEATLPSVRVDNRAGMRQATRYLVQLGHRRIGFIKGIAGHGASLDRYLGYQDGLSEAGLDENPELVRQGDYEETGGVRCARELLALGNRPTAILASNDQMAVGVLAAALEIQVQVPDQLSVIGFDDIPLARRVFPTLTTVHQPLEEMGCEAVRMALELLEGELPAQSVRLVATHLVIRRSTRLAPNLGRNRL